MAGALKHLKFTLYDSYPTPRKATVLEYWFHLQASAERHHQLKGQAIHAAMRCTPKTALRKSKTTYGDKKQL